MKLSVKQNSFKLKKKFTISRGSKVAAEVLTLKITSDGYFGWSECVPYERYHESLQTVTEQLKSCALPITLQELQKKMLPGAARNALDCALWDLEAKINKKPVWELLNIKKPEASVTAYTISLDNPANMLKEAREKSHYPLLKVKLGGRDDENRVRAVRSGAPKSRIIVDANEGWSRDTYKRLIPNFKNLGVELIEQPFRSTEDHILAELDRIIPICADESCHDEKSLKNLAGLYDCINIKLDKTGGLTEALKLLQAGKQKGYKIMLGCMVGTSLSMAPAMLLAHMCDFVDLDGPLLLKEDRMYPLKYRDYLVEPSNSFLWGNISS